MKIPEFQKNSDNLLLIMITSMVNFNHNKRPSILEICFVLAS